MEIYPRSIVSNGKQVRGGVIVFNKKSPKRRFFGRIKQYEEYN